MTNFTDYTVTPGQRWDAIAYATLNDPYGYEQIIALNPEYSAKVLFDTAVTLRIPVVEESTEISPELLPPWRR